MVDLGPGEEEGEEVMEEREMEKGLLGVGEEPKQQVIARDAVESIEVREGGRGGREGERGYGEGWKKWRRREKGWDNSCSSECCAE